MKVWLLQESIDYEGDTFMGLYFKLEDAKNCPELPANLDWVDGYTPPNLTSAHPEWPIVHYDLCLVEIEGTPDDSTLVS